MLKAFDSLLEAGRFPEARLLCAGQMLRMFDFIAMAHAKTAGLIDTSRSRETTLEEKDDGTWAYVKISGLMAFKRPFMGQDSIRSVQAVHLFHRTQGRRGPERGGWLIAEMEELESEASPVRLRTGSPEGTAPAGSAPARHRPERRPEPVPRFSRAPARAGEADRLRYRLRLRNGAALAAACRLGPDQILVRAVSPSEWILENRRATPFSAASTASADQSDRANRRIRSGSHGSAAAGHLAHLPVLQRLPRPGRHPADRAPPRASPEPKRIPAASPRRSTAGYATASGSSWAPCSSGTAAASSAI